MNNRGYRSPKDAQRNPYRDVMNLDERRDRSSHYSDNGRYLNHYNPAYDSSEDIPTYPYRDVMDMNERRNRSSENCASRKYYYQSIGSTNNEGYESNEDAPRNPQRDVMNMDERRERTVENPGNKKAGKKSPTQKGLKAVKKAIKMGKKLDADEPDAEAPADAPPNGGPGGAGGAGGTGGTGGTGGVGSTGSAWTIVAGSAVMNSTNSVVKVVLHETEKSINADFSSPKDTLNYSECFNGLNYTRKFVNVSQFGPVINCLDEGIPEFFTCLKNLLGNPTQKAWPSWITRFCSYLWTPPHVNLTESNSLVSTELLADDTSSASGGTGTQDDVGTTMNMVFVFLSLGCILLAAVIAVFVGYRIVSIIGSVLVAVGFLAASFLPNDQQLAIQILIGGVAGAGSAFLKLTAIVAILECFEEKRMRAIVISGLGAVLVNFLVVGLTFIEGLHVDWRTSFRLQLIPAGFSLAAGLFLKPFKLKRKRKTSQSSDGSGTYSRKCSESILSKELFTNIVFYLVLVVYFLDQIGRPFFSDSIQPIMTEKKYSSLQVDLQPIIQNGGSFLGLIILLFWKKHDMVDILTVMTGLNVLIGLLVLHVAEMPSYAWAGVYSAMFGFSDGIFASVLQDSIPKCFERRHVRIVAGFLGFTAALGSLGAEYIGKAIDNNDTSMYLSGVVLITSGAMAFLSRLIVNRKKSDDNDDSVDN